MYTQCPHCHSVYRVGIDELSAAGGRVQCGACDAEFNAARWLRESLPEPAAKEWQSAELPLATPEDATEASPEGDREELPSRESAFAMPAPALAQPSRRMQAFWVAASLALALVLIAQILFVAPDALARNPELRPVATALCRLSGCEVPPRADLSRLRLASRDVRAHPSVPGALIIGATMVNEADFTQSFPVLEIALADLQGRPVAVRRFRPTEYLPERVDVSSGMAPDSIVQVSLEVSDPGEKAVAFEFAFRPSRETAR